jgi:hypothetical protein
MVERRISASPSGNAPTPRGGVLIQLHLTGLIIFSVALVVASVLVTRSLVAMQSSGSQKQAQTRMAEMPSPAVTGMVQEQKDPPPWGQLTTWDIDLEQPEEYLAFEIATNRMETWTFESMAPPEVRSLMQSCGLGAREIDRALSSPLLSSAHSNTIVTPDEDLVFSLTPESRAKLYSALGHCASNHLMQFPFCLVGSSADAKFAGSPLDDTVLAALRKLLYPRGNAECFSDLEIMLRRLPTEKERLLLLKAVSRQSAVMARVQIWPDTDIDKLIGYWGHGIQAKDLRPLLESLKRVPGGASISLLYFLPQFARQRLYTYPEPSKPRDPVMDCHWSTMNFFNDIPDNRFSDPKYTVTYLQAKCYTIAQPSAYGDIIFLLNQQGNAIHSAVYLADGIVFTKNGNNFAQPWMLMHLDDLVARYTSDVAPPMVVYRNKNR